jgi:hypothetical protein
MDKDTRNRIERATQAARGLLEQDFADQLAGVYDIRLDGTLTAEPGSHLDAAQRLVWYKLMAAVEHHRASGQRAPDAVATYLREAAFTTLNRFVALKMLEARGLVQECVSRGEQSSGFKEFCGLAPGLVQLPDHGYRLYIESLFDELSTEVKVLFDRRDLSSLLWPRRATFERLLEGLNAAELAPVWGEDETIGWVYQFFNGQDERRKMREASQAPRNSRELAVRNQFFTPRYVVQFLTDNTLGRIWYEMRGTQTALAETCEYMVRKPGETFASRAKKDPRDLRVLDPACGSGHFLLYAFDLLLTIYEEAHADPETPKSEATGRTLAQDYPSLDALRIAVPGLALAHNLHGVDIDPRCAQIAQLALWMRAQRAYRDFGIGRAERPSIRRSNIVVAEPLVTDGEIAKEFVAKLDDPELGRVFMSLVESLSVAGEMGLLLRVEKLVARQPKRGETGHLFAPPEERIRAAIDRFVCEEASTRRRLFADDTAHGMALLGAAETRFDVVLMNPPFGDFVGRSQQDAKKQYPAGANDIFTAMVMRGRELLSADGRLGAITSRAFLLGRDHRRFREALLGEEGHRLALLLDLGSGVLDQALVETAAYVIGSDYSEIAVRSLTEVANKEMAARENVDWEFFDHSHFRSMPMFQLIYKLEPTQGSALADRTQSLEPAFGRVTKGLSTPDNFRFLRLRWEIARDSLERGWQLCAKGGDYGWFSGDLYLLVNRRDDGKEMAAASELADGNIARTRQSSAYYGRAAATWSCRSQKGFSARRLRRGACFLHKSGVIIPIVAGADESALPAVIAALTTVKYQALIAAQSRFGAYETGMVGLLPIPSRLIESKEDWTELPRLIDAFEGHDERTLLFKRPCASEWKPADQLGSAFDRLESRLVKHGHALDASVRRFEIERTETVYAEVEHVAAWRSFAFGLAIGRWRPDALIASRAKDDEDLFANLGAASALQAVSSSASLLADDEGSPNDVVACVLASVITAECDRLVAPYAFSVDRQDLRRWFARDFFPYHLGLYSRSQRKAPIYWQLATPSAGYSVWLYIHAFNKDTLFRVQNDYVAPKLAHEERRLDALTTEFRDGATAAQRKELAAQESLVEELRAFLAEVKRVAPLWNPDLDDGVIINFAPLWRLVPQHKPWQKELKSTWDALCDGQYDWAHLAMHLWPERVVPKCAEDRSLAIAHGLEAVFWEEGDNGKWRPLRVAQTEVDRLIVERTSAAVKDALNSLLEAPAPVTGRGSGRKPSGRASLARAPAAPRSGDAGPDSRPATSSVTPEPALLDAVKQAIAAAQGGTSKSEVLAATGLTDAQWNLAINALLAEGAVTKTGAARGTRYHLTTND